MTIFAVVLGVILVMVAGLVVVKAAINLVLEAQRTASTTAMEVVERSIATMFGGQEPAVQLPGNEESPQADTHYYPPWEGDELSFPGSTEEIRGMEAGWAPNRTDQPPAGS